MLLRSKSTVDSADSSKRTIQNEVSSIKLSDDGTKLLLGVGPNVSDPKNLLTARRSNCGRTERTLRLCVATKVTTNLASSSATVSVLPRTSSSYLAAKVDPCFCRANGRFQCVRMAHAFRRTARSLGGAYRYSQRCSVESEQE